MIRGQRASGSSAWAGMRVGEAGVVRMTVRAGQVDSAGVEARGWVAKSKRLVQMVGSWGML